MIEAWVPGTGALSYSIRTNEQGAISMYDPISAYESRSIEGFNVLNNRRIIEQGQEGGEAIREMESQLRNISGAILQTPLARLREVRIWMEWHEVPDGLGEFHWGKEWLIQKGRNPEKALAVEIVNARNFVEWSRQDQPWSVLHELSHSYHCRVLGDHHLGIQAAFDNARANRLYEHVARIHHDAPEDAYADKNYQEYFAELSEAYFGKNDFYPFTRDELRLHDPVGFKLMEEVWQ
jgi:hypothetical protein